MQLRGASCGWVLQFLTVKTAERNKLAVVMACHLIWGYVLWFSISKYGLGVSTDSVHLLFGGLNLAAGRGLISYDGSFLILWPPLYPVLLALVHLASGLDMLATAGVLQAAAFLGLSVCLSIFFLRIFPDNFSLAIAANVLCDVGAVVLIAFDEVGSDYVHLLLVMLCVLLTGYYVESKSPRVFVALAAVGMLATLERYLGIAALATGAAGAVFLVDGSIGRRLMRGLILSVAAVPAAMWLAITSQLYGRRGPISFSENFNWFSKSILQWFSAAQAAKAHSDARITVLWGVIAALIILVGFAWYRLKAKVPESARAFTVPVFIFALCYGLALFGSAALAYSNKLGGRFLLPLYIPSVTLLVVALGLALRGAAGHSTVAQRAVVTVSAGILLLAAVLLLKITVPVVTQSHAEGAVGGENAFNTAVWRENQAMKYWTSHPPQGQYSLFSNQPDGVAFLTQHATGSSPRKTSGPYATDNYPLSDYIPDLFSADSDVYLVWIEPGSAKYFYTVDELASIAKIEPLFVGGDGGVYRLLPRSGS